MNDDTNPVPALLADDLVGIVPMRNVVLFPHVLMPVTVGRPKSVAALRHALAAKAVLGIVLQKDPKADDPGLDELCEIGTLANIVQHRDADVGQIHAICQGLQRVRLLGRTASRCCACRRKLAHAPRNRWTTGSAASSCRSS